MILAKLTIYSKEEEEKRRGLLWVNKVLCLLFKVVNPAIHHLTSPCSLTHNVQEHETRQATSHPTPTTKLLPQNNACGQSEQCSHYETALSQDERLAGMLL